MRWISGHRGAASLALSLLLLLMLVVAVEGNGKETELPAPAERPSGLVYWGAWVAGAPYRGAGGGWRDAPWGSRTWKRFERNVGDKRVSILHFGQPAPWAQPFSRIPLELTRRRGAIPLVDMDTADPARRGGREVTLREIAGGGRDRQLRRWARAAARYGAPFFLRLNWEMNGTWFPWGQEAARAPGTFVRAWRRFHDIAEAARATNVTWVWCPNVVYDGSTPLRHLYPGDDYVDWTCMDGYNHGRHPTHPSGWVSFADLFARTYAKLLSIAPRKPIMIGETASSEVRANGRDPAAKAAWIRDALTTQIPKRFPRIKAVNWFNWNIRAGGAEERWDWPIESSVAARRAFAKAIASPYYAENRFGGLRRHTRVRPLG